MSPLIYGCCTGLSQLQHPSYVRSLKFSSSKTLHALVKLAMIKKISALTILFLAYSKTFTQTAPDVSAAYFFLLSPHNFLSQQSLLHSHRLLELQPL